MTSPALCRRCCVTPLPPKPQGRRGPAQAVCAECRRLASNRDRRRYRERARRRTAPAAPREPPTPREDLGPEWPLLLPPAEAWREREAQERRIRQAVADGLGYAELEERFGQGARSLLESLGLRIGPRTGLPAGVPR